jgi:hypothetical protein
MSSVRLVAERQIPASGVVCMALAHNEMKRVEDFLRHYRSLGIAHFLILDDNSTDGTAQHLRAQSDVTLFAPDGTSYRDHKVAWRSDILDAYASGRWVVVPDLDELFVYPHCDVRRIDVLAAHLEWEGAEAMFTPMVEMYADAPLDRAHYQPGQSMLAAFPFFDGRGYRLVRPRYKQLKAFPTPPLDLYGSPRERMFYDFSSQRIRGPRGWAVRRFANLDRSMTPGRLERAGNTLARFALSGKAPRPPLVMSKIGLLKWRKGLRFSGGPHSVSEAMALSAIWGALLHFKFMDLPGEVSYRAMRQQHAGGSRHYKKLEAKGGFGRSALYEGSRRYTSWRDLMACGLLRNSDSWNAGSETVERGKTKVA